MTRNIGKRSRFRMRYGRYRVFFFLAFAFFLLAAAAEWILYGAGLQTVTLKAVDRLPFFAAHFTWEAIFYLSVFLTGITVYAPFLLFFTAVMRGLYSGYILSGLSFSFFDGGWTVFVLTLFYLLFSTQIFLGYASFCTMVSLRLFTDGVCKTGAAEEKRMFGGTLFCSTFFCETVNLRFLSMYLLLLFLSLSLTAAHSYLFCFLRSLL